METSWRGRKNSLDITALDAAVKAVIDVNLPNGKIPKIMKRHYKENFVRYDIGIGTVGYKDAESYEKTVAEPVFDTIKERAVKNGWKAFYQPSYGSRGSVAWMDYYVQLRIPYDNTTTIQEGTYMNSIYKQMNEIDDKESLDEKYNKNGVNVTKLPEMISESNFLEPILVRVKIDTSDAKFKKGYDLQAAIKRTISGVTMQPEIRVDESDGSYQLCFPGKSDWLKSVTEMLQYNISGKLTVEEV